MTSASLEGQYEADSRWCPHIPPGSSSEWEPRRLMAVEQRCCFWVCGHTTCDHTLQHCPRALGTDAPSEGPDATRAGTQR